MAENAERNLRLLQELITCTHNLYFWTYDVHFSLTYSNCPDFEIMNHIFLSVSLGVPKEVDAPILVSSRLGFSWVVNLERDGNGEPLYYHVIGPALTSQVSVDMMKSIMDMKRKEDSILDESDESVEKMLSRMPTIPMPRLLEYGLMLHYCIMEEKLTVSDVVYWEVQVDSGMEPCRCHEDKEGWGEESRHTGNPQGTWLMEQRLLKLISDGNLNYKQESNKLVSDAMPADLGSGDVLRHYKNLNICFSALCARAAIKGGLSPELAYMLNDKYIHGIETCNTLSEIAEVNEMMQDDFVRRVHKCKIKELSLQIKQCCDYIQIHVEKKLSLTEISNAVGYAETWLSGKFRKETGKTISQYIAEQKVRRAKELLRSTNLPIQEIAERLKFKSQSHFGETFRRYAGMTAGEYRMHQGDS